MVALALSYLPTGQSQSQEKGRGPAGSHSTLPISSSSEGFHSLRPRPISALPSLHSPSQRVWHNWLDHQGP